MTADRPHGKDMITLTSHKTVLTAMAEGERQGMSLKWMSLRQASQTVREKITSLDYILTQLLSKTNKGAS